MSNIIKIGGDQVIICSVPETISPFICLLLGFGSEKVLESLPFVPMTIDIACNRALTLAKGYGAGVTFELWTGGKRVAHLMPPAAP